MGSGIPESDIPALLGSFSVSSSDRKARPGTEDGVHRLLPGKVSDRLDQASPRVKCQVYLDYTVPVPGVAEFQLEHYPKCCPSMLDARIRYPVRRTNLYPVQPAFSVRHYDE